MTAVEAIAGCYVRDQIAAKEIVGRYSGNGKVARFGSRYAFNESSKKRARRLDETTRRNRFLFGLRHSELCETKHDEHLSVSNQYLKVADCRGTI